MNRMSSGLSNEPPGELPSQIFRRWTHSYEDDAADARAYRPVEYEFPPARGRAGLEFRPDGTFIDWEIAPTDAQRGIHGSWRVDESGHLHVSTEQGLREGRVFEIIECDDQILKLRQLPVPT
jgi:hypothetical protein